MIWQKKRRPAALLLAAVLLALSACGTGDKPQPDAAPNTSQSPPPSQQAGEPIPSQGSEPPAPSGSPTLPTESTGPQPSESASPRPSQSEAPSPPESTSPEPSDPPVEFQPPADGSAVAQGEDVGSDWFSDAVFLGDSRTDGLRLYSGIKGASFICHAGLSVFTVDSNACIKADDGSKITAIDALAKQRWAKVYLMLGINELGYSTTSFKNTYTGLVEQIKQLQPGAAIYLQTLIPVNEPLAYEHGTNRAINNEKLKEFNEVIAQIAQEQSVFLVDVDTPFWSAEGCLDASLTGDGVHLTRAGYTDWYAYLRTHTGSSPAADASVPAAPSGTVLPPQASPPADDQGLLPPPIQAA